MFFWGGMTNHLGASGLIQTTDYLWGYTPPRELWCGRALDTCVRWSVCVCEEVNFRAVTASSFRRVQRLVFGDEWLLVTRGVLIEQLTVISSPSLSLCSHSGIRVHVIEEFLRVCSLWLCTASPQSVSIECATVHVGLQLADVFLPWGFCTDEEKCLLMIC